MTHHTSDLSRVDGLREWAKGSYGLEAAVELLIRFNHGRLLGDVWIQQTNSRYWFNPEGVPRYWFSPEEVPLEPSGLSGGEHRVLMIAATLADPFLIKVGLGHLVTGLDRDALDLVLAAIAHAGGSHEHSQILVNVDDGSCAGTRSLPSLHEWPPG